MRIRRVFAALLLAGLAACNTMEGLGRDVASAGEELSKAADRSK